MTLKPDPTAVGIQKTSSATQIGDTPDMATKPTGPPGVQHGGGRWGDTVFRSLATAAGATIIGAIAFAGAVFIFILSRNA